VAELNKGCEEGKDTERILVLANDSDEPHQLEFTTARTGLEACSLITPLLPSSAEEIKSSGEGKLSVTVKLGATIYSVQWIWIRPKHWPELFQRLICGGRVQTSERNGNECWIATERARLVDALDNVPGGPTELREAALRTCVQGWIQILAGADRALQTFCADWL